MIVGFYYLSTTYVFMCGCVSDPFRCESIYQVSAL